MEDLLKSGVAVEILKNLSEFEEGNRPTKMAEELERTRPTVSRLLAMMKDEDIVIQDGETRTTPYKIDYEGLASYWADNLVSAWNERYEERRAEIAELTSQRDQIERFGAEFFREKLSGEPEDGDLYEFLFETPAINLSLYLEMKDTDEPDYLNILKRGLLTFVSKRYNEQNFESIINKLNS